MIHVTWCTRNLCLKSRQSMDCSIEMWCIDFWNKFDVSGSSFTDQVNPRFLPDDNAPAYSSIIVSQFLAKNVTIHPPYSRDLHLPALFFFSKLKLMIKRTCYEDAGAIQHAVTEHLNAISREEFFNAFQRLRERCTACMAKGGMYIKN